ncbi:MAG: hypothetical protein RLZZ162_2472, partial [Verrucomicrobiota bacterium]
MSPLSRLLVAALGFTTFVWPVAAKNFRLILAPSDVD